MGILRELGETCYVSEFEEHFLKCEERKWRLECWNDDGRKPGGPGGGR